MNEDLRTGNRDFPGLEAELPAGAPMDHPLFPVLFPVPSPSAL